MVGAAAVVLLAVCAILGPGGLSGVRPSLLGETGRSAGVPLKVPPDASPRHYRFLQHQPGDPDAPVTWDPCQVIRIAINTAGVADQDRARDIVLDAMTVVAAATGLRMHYVGPTTRRPHWGTADRAGEPVLVAFATSAEVPKLKGRVAGVGGSTSVRRHGQRTYVSGEVTLDSNAFSTLLEQPAFLASARAITLHELGHLVGLAHVEDRQELMNAQNTDQLDFGPGDRRGLTRLGEGRCR
jgi:matrixin